MLPKVKVNSRAADAEARRALQPSLYQIKKGGLVLSGRYRCGILLM